MSVMEENAIDLDLCSSRARGFMINCSRFGCLFPADLMNVTDKDVAISLEYGFLMLHVKFFQFFWFLQAFHL